MSPDAIERAVAILQARAHGKVSPGGSIGALTSYRLGGPAGVLLDAASDADLEALADALASTALPLLVIGRGSNMLVSDRGFDGIAVRLGGGFRWERVRDESIEAGAAFPLPSLATLAMQHDLTGVEFGVAIPASLGGAVRMNAGAHGHEIAEVLAEVTLYRLDERRSQTLPAAQAGFAYRTSHLPADSIVTAARLSLRAGDPASILSLMNEAKEWRRATQPLNLPNGGSVFKNPHGDHAARLVESVCGKALSVGGARISEVHANFIVAEPGARADHVYTLIRRIQAMVSDATGVVLEPELKLIGVFEEVTG